MARETGFADCGCAPVAPLGGSKEECRYLEAERLGQFGQMEYLQRNVDKRMAPSLLLPDAKSVIGFLAPFSSGGCCKTEDGLKISEFALGRDYHTAIKNKLFRIASFIEGHSRVFTDSAPIMERAWATCLSSTEPLTSMATRRRVAKSRLLPIYWKP